MSFIRPITLNHRWLALAILAVMTFFLAPFTTTDPCPESFLSKTRACAYGDTLTTDHHTRSTDHFLPTIYTYVTTDNRSSAPPTPLIFVGFLLVGTTTTRRKTTPMTHRADPPPSRRPRTTNSTAYRYDHRHHTFPSEGFNTPTTPSLKSAFYYYGYRYYDPVTGRWPSRDPIEEIGGINLYGFLSNEGVRIIDLLGMAGIFDFFEDKKSGDLSINGLFNSLEIEEGAFRNITEAALPQAGLKYTTTKYLGFSPDSNPGFIDAIRNSEKFEKGGVLCQCITVQFKGKGTVSTQKIKKLIVGLSPTLKKYEKFLTVSGGFEVDFKAADCSLASSPAFDVNKITLNFEVGLTTGIGSVDDLVKPYTGKIELTGEPVYNDSGLSIRFSGAGATGEVPIPFTD